MTAFVEKESISWQIGWLSLIILSYMCNVSTPQSQYTYINISWTHLGHCWRYCPSSTISDFPVHAIPIWVRLIYYCFFLQLRQHLIMSDDRWPLRVTFQRLLLSGIMNEWRRIKFCVFSSQLKYKSFVMCNLLSILSLFLV